jgi:release factor glutamine methyltransferase
VLLAHAIGVDRTALIAHPDAPVGPAAEATFRGSIERRAAGEPVAYIRGFKEFYGIALATDRRALIPRPETELLVELAEREAIGRLVGVPRPPGTPHLRVVDVGTGAGTIAVTLAVLLRRRGAIDEVDILATDASADALALARENAVGHGVADRISFSESDLVPEAAVPFDLVLANLPYVRSAAVPNLPIAAAFEPRAALDGGPDGLDVVRRLLGRLPDVLAPGGVALLEIGFDQGEAIVDAVGDQLPGWRCTVVVDLSRQPRVARVERAAA